MFRLVVVFFVFHLIRAIKQTIQIEQIIREKLN